MDKRKYITTFTKVKKELGEKAEELEILRRALEQEVKRKELEEFSSKLNEITDVLKKIDIDEVIKSIRGIEK